MNDLTFAQTLVLLLALFWSLFWKWKALWKAAKKNQKYWFTVLLFINSLGLLEIAYFYYFSKNKKKV